MKKFLIIILTLFITLNGVSQIESIRNKLQQIIGEDWIVEINDSLDFTHPYLTKGEYIATLFLTSRNDTIEILMYSSSDPDFENEITNYHRLASCFLTKENFKLKILENENYFLFLPFYTCWDGGYSEKEKEVIKIIFQ